MKKHNLISKTLGIILAFVLVGAMLPLGAFVSHSQVEASPGTIYVPDDYSTIQAAIDAANPGDTIIVRDGAYTENVDVNKDNLTIRSENGAQATIVQAANSDNCVFWILADYVSISGFTVEGATGVVCVGEDCYAMVGIYVCGAEHCSVFDNRARDNFYGIGVGYSARNNVIASNSATNNTCGIAIYSSYNNSVIDCNVLNNTQGIAIRADPFVNSGNTVYLNSFIDNIHNVVCNDLTNIWYSPEQIVYFYNGNTYTSYLGNYWDDYAGSDADGDGIGETSYPIDSDADNYPLVEPFENYEIGPVPPEEWSFVFITDPHVGVIEDLAWYEYSTSDFKDFNYSSIGWSKDETGPECLSTSNLRTILRTISSIDDISFVVFGGDLTESGELSEFIKFREIVDEELGDIPWIPIPGNHDLLPYSTDKDGADLELVGQLFAGRFIEQYSVLRGQIGENWDKQPLIADNGCLQNFSFDYRGYHFVFLDFNSREDNEFNHPNHSYGSAMNGELHDFANGTWHWLISDVKAFIERKGEGHESAEDIILFSHHPFIHMNNIIGMDVCFDNNELNTIIEELRPYASRIWGQFAGHTHRDHTSTLEDYPTAESVGEILQIIETNADCKIPTATLTLFTSEGIGEPSTRTGDVAWPTSSDEWQSVLQVGDILYETAGINHVGIYVGTGIVEALPIGGVQERTVDSWNWDSRENVYILRVDTTVDKQIAAAEFASEQAEQHKAYDSDLIQKDHDPSSLSWYCSELVWAAYYNQGIDIEHTPDRFAVLPVEIFVSDNTAVVGGHVEYKGDFALSVTVYSPVDIVITDPDGLVYSREQLDSSNAIYFIDDTDEDGEPEDSILIGNRKNGDYLIELIPKPDALPDDTYTLVVSANGETIVLADDVQISDIPDQGYIIRSTETEIMQIIPADIEFDPDVLNLKSKGKYVTAYIELPPGYDVGQIDIASIRLNDTVPALSKPTEVDDYDSDGVADLMVKFDKAAVQDALTVGEEVEVTITGEVAGITFEGGDNIRVITAAAAHGRGEWTRVSTPTTEGWVLAPDSVIVDYAVADDGGVAYAIVYSYDTSQFYLLKSTDGAATWEDTMDALEEEADGDISWLVAVATDAQDAEFMAVAFEMTDLSVHVFISDDGGATFEDAGEVEDGGVYFPDGYCVSGLEVSPEMDGVRDIAVSGMDDSNDAALFRCTVTGDSAGDWEDATTYVGWDDDGTFTSMLVTDIIFSPSWDEDRTILVTTVTETGMDIYTVHLQSGYWGTSEGWNEKSTLGIEAVPIIEDVDIPMWLADFDARRVAGITTPSDYDSKSTDTRMLWVWVNYYDYSGYPIGEIMRVDDDAVCSVGPMGQVEDGEVWLTNVSYKGTIAEGEAIAGVLGAGTYDPVHGSPDELLTECCEGVQVYRNDGVANMDICCIRWGDACKPPTGAFAMEAFYVGEDKAYAVSLWGFFSPYDEDAWSVTFDDGDTWNQLSLIDTHIGYLSDVAVSPDCNKTMLASVNDDNGCGCDSVWLHAESLPEAPEYSGKWLRTWCGQLEGHLGGGWERGLLRLAPEETTGDNVYLVDYGSNNVYWNDLETLSCWDPIGCTVLDEIVDLAAQDADTLYALDYYGDVAMFDEYEWYEAVDSEVEHGWTIAVQGDDILVGGCDGDVSYSDDGGETFTELEQVPVVAADYTLVTVAFDSYFDANDTIYAAVAGWTGTETEGGIYLWVIGESDEWEDLGAEDYAYTGLVLNVPSGGKPKTSADTGGVLYASYVSGDTTGVARCLTPAADVRSGRIKWDYLTRGLTSELFKMTPQALKICGCLTPGSNSKLLAIDSSEYYDMVEGLTGTVWRFED